MTDDDEQLVDKLGAAGWVDIGWVDDGTEPEATRPVGSRWGWESVGDDWESAGAMRWRPGDPIYRGTP